MTTLMPEEELSPEKLDRVDAEMKAVHLKTRESPDKAHATHEATPCPSQEADTRTPPPEPPPPSQKQIPLHKPHPETAKNSHNNDFNIHQPQNQGKHHKNSQKR